MPFFTRSNFSRIVWMLFFSSSSKDPASFAVFAKKIETIITTTNLENGLLVHAAHYLHTFVNNTKSSGRRRLKRTSDEIFKLVVTLLMVANKCLDDSSFTLKTWVSLSNLTAKTLKSMELLVLQTLNYQVFLKAKAYKDWCDSLHKLSEVHNLVTSTPSPSKRRMEQYEEDYPTTSKKSRHSDLLFSSPTHNSIHNNNNNNNNNHLLTPVSSSQHSHYNHYSSKDPIVLPSIQQFPQLPPPAPAPQHQQHHYQHQHQPQQQIQYQYPVQYYYPSPYQYQPIYDMFDKPTPLQFDPVSLPVPPLNIELFEPIDAVDPLESAEAAQYMEQTPPHPKDCSCCYLTNMTNSYYSSIRNTIVKL